MIEPLVLPLSLTSTGVFGGKFGNCAGDEDTTGTGALGAGDA